MSLKENYDTKHLLMREIKYYDREFQLLVLPYLILVMEARAAHVI